MSEIDYRPNSAPMPGVGRPSLNEVTRYLKEDPQLSWHQGLCNRRDHIARSFWIWVCLFAAASVTIFVCAFLFANPYSVAEFGLPKNLHSLYAVVKDPSASFLATMDELHKRGVQIRLITAKQGLETEYQTVVMPANRLSEEGVLVDGVSWRRLSQVLDDLRRR